MLDISISREDMHRLEGLIALSGIEFSSLTRKQLIRQIRERMMHTSKHSLSDYLDFAYRAKREQKELKIAFISEKMPFLIPDLEITDEEFKRLGVLLNSVGINISSLKKAHLLRRIRMRMSRTGNKSSFSDYLQYAKSSEEEQKKLRLAFSINVTRFFRDKTPFEYIKNEILPKLRKLNPTKTVKVWSAGCAAGAEPYSLAILCKELNLAPIRVEITATDFNSELLKAAKIGIYPKEYVVETAQEIQTRYFTHKSPENVQISKQLKNYIVFKYGNLTDDSEKNLGIFDLVVCRNVLIYFSEEEKLKVFKKFYKALKPQGFLILGMTEILPFSYRKDFRIYSEKYRVYMKK